MMYLWLLNLESLQISFCRVLNQVWYRWCETAAGRLHHLSPIFQLFLIWLLVDHTSKLEALFTVIWDAKPKYAPFSIKTIVLATYWKLLITINSGSVVWWHSLRLWKMAKKLEHICFVELYLLSIYHLMMFVGWYTSISIYVKHFLFVI